MIASKHTADTITHKFYHLYQAAPEQKAPLQQILKIIIIFQIFSPLRDDGTRRVLIYNYWLLSWDGEEKSVNMKASLS